MLFLNERYAMLDAYIIERIRRERESREQGKRLPLRVNIPRPMPRDPRRKSEQPISQDRERGITIVDYGV